MIEAAGLSKDFAGKRVVSGVTFNVAQGEVLGFLGPNGAGKTTTIRMITGFLEPTEGSVRIGGQPLSKTTRRQIGYLPENTSPYPEMRVSEYLRFRADLQGVSGRRFDTDLDRLLDRCLLTEVQDQIVGNLSKGYRQRLGLASALVHDPPVLVLDEPTVGLDPKQIIKIRQLIKDLGRERTVLLSTHILPEVELICDRVVIIDDGRIVASGKPEGLRSQLTGSPTLVVEVLEADGAELVAKLAGVPGVRSARAGEGRTVIVDVEQGADLRADLARHLRQLGLTPIELHQQRLSLEDVFVRLTTREAPPAPGEGT